MNVPADVIEDVKPEVRERLGLRRTLVAPAWILRLAAEVVRLERREAALLEHLKRKHGCHEVTP